MPSFALVGVLLRKYMKIVLTSAQKHGGIVKSCSIVRVPFVATPTCHSATPFDEGDYGTDELIRIHLCSQYSFILLATSSFASSNITISTSAGTPDFALNGSTQAYT